MRRRLLSYLLGMEITEMNWELINEIVVDTPVEEIIITLPKKYRKICLYIDLCSETDTTYNINIKTDVDYEK